MIDGLKDARVFEAKILELSIETLKIESGACDLPPEGSKEKEFWQIRERGISRVDF